MDAAKDEATQEPTAPTTDAVTEMPVAVATTAATIVDTSAMVSLVTFPRLRSSGELSMVRGLMAVLMGEKGGGG